jgi:transposase
MATKLELRSVMPEAERALRKVAASRTTPARLGQRAKILVTMLDEPEMGAMEAGRRAGLSGQTGCAWVKRFNEGGLDVLEDAPRGGRPPTHPPRCGAPW